jgi:uncharacterized protein YodC (DUF2158 family)
LLAYVSTWYDQSGNNRHATQTATGSQPLIVSSGSLVTENGKPALDNRPLIENNINNYYNIYTGSNHGFVARWYDQSGNNRHATQTATGSQPMIVESG